MPRCLSDSKSPRLGRGPRADLLGLPGTWTWIYPLMPGDPVIDCVIVSLPFMRHRVSVDGTAKRVDQGSHPLRTTGRTGVTERDQRIRGYPTGVKQRIEVRQGAIDRVTLLREGPQIIVDLLERIGLGARGTDRPAGRRMARSPKAWSRPFAGPPRQSPQSLPVTATRSLSTIGKLARYSYDRSRSAKIPRNIHLNGSSMPSVKRPGNWAAYGQSAWRVPRYRTDIATYRIRSL